MQVGVSDDKPINGISVRKGTLSVSAVPREKAASGLDYTLVICGWGEVAVAENTAELFQVVGKQ